MKTHLLLRRFRGVSNARRLLALIFLLSSPMLFAQSITTGATFGGMDQSYTGWGPISPNGAVGPNYVCQMIDTNLAVFSRSGQYIEAQDMSKFAGGDGINQTVLYDPTAQRWAVCGGVTAAYFGISDTADPTQGWTEHHTLSFPGSGDGGRFGFNASAYFVVYPSHPTNPDMIVIDKSSILDKNNGTFTSYNVINAPGGRTLMEDDTTTGNPSDPMWFYDSTHLYAMTNYLSNSPTVTTYNVTGGTIASSKYAEIRNGKLMCLNDLGTLNWTITDIASATVEQSGTIPVPAGYASTNYTYCSLAANGDIGVTFIAYSADGRRMAMFVTGRAPSDPPGTMRTPVAVVNGTHTSDRMGDYGSVFDDPATGTFWAFHNPDNAFSSTGISNFGVSNLPPATLAPVTGLGMAPSDGTSVNLQWNTVPGATGYQLLRTTDNVTFTTVTTLSGTATSYTDTPAAPVSAYYYDVVATNGTTSSAAPGVVHVALNPAPPTYDGLSAPGGLTASLGTGNAIQLSWNSVTGGTGYYVERAGNGATWTRLGTTGTGVLQYTDTNPAGSNLYFYRAGTLDSSGGQSAPSASVSIVNCPSFGRVILTALWSNQVDLHWSSVLSATGFTIYRSTDNVNFTAVGTSPENYFNYTDTTVAAGTMYYYQVVANGVVGNSLAGTVTALPLISPPSGLTISQGASQLALHWNAVSGAVDYQVQRSTDGTNFSTISTVTSTGFTDTSVAPLQPYYYQILTDGSGAGNTSVPSDIASGVLPAPLPSQWQSQDIGLGSSVAGGAGYDAGSDTYTIVGEGARIQSTSDQFHYIYQSLGGDGTIIARVVAQQNTSAYAQAGVMIRDGIGANAANVFMAITPTNGASLLYRGTAGNPTTVLGSTGGVAAPYWLKLVRTGNTFTGYSSADGITWTQVASTSIVMGSSVTIGLAEGSANVAAFNTTTFDHVLITPMTATDATLTISSPGGSGTASILAGATGPIGATLSMINVTQGMYGTAVNNGDGTVTYTSNLPYATSDVFTCTISDGLGDTVTAAVNVVIAGSGLQAYWKFDDGTGATAADSTGNGSTGTLSNSPTWTTGTIGGALSFNGTNQYVSAPVSNISQTSYGVSFWFKTSSSNGGLFDVNTSPAGTTSLDRDIYLSGGNLKAYVYNTETITTSTGLNLTNGQWHHVVHTFGGAVGGQKLYVDGVLRASGSKSSSDFTWPTCVNIGFAGAASTRYFSGTIDDVRLYNTALSSSAVTALYNDRPPTVATAAAASPSTVSGPRTGLSVLGASAAGESTLTYSWAATSIPSGTATPCFSANCTNAAKNTVVNFYAPGSYTLACTITDANGLSVVSSATVTVSQVQLAWSGGGGNANWSNSANWSGGIAPQWGDQLTLTGSSNNDLPAGTIFTSIILQGNNVTLSGNRITVAQGSSPAVISTGTNNSIGNAIELASNATISATSGGLTLTGTINNYGHQLTVAAAGSATVSIPATVIGGGGLVASGSGTVALSGSNNYGGGTTITAGRLIEQGNGWALGTGATGIGGGAVLELSNSAGTSVTQHATTFTGAGTIQKTGTGTVLFGGNGGNVNVCLSAGGLVDVEAGTLAGSSSFNGIWSGNLGSLNIASGATFDGVEGAIYVDALTGSGTLKGGYSTTKTTTIGVANGSGIFSGVIKNGLAAFALTKSGTGAEALSGANLYTGATTVNGGTLLTTGNISSSATTVNGGGTLAGTGTAGAVTVAAGTLAPGSGGTGTLTLASKALSLSGVTTMDINQSTGTSDKVQGITTLTYGGTLTVTNLAGTLTEGNTFTLFSAGSYAGTFSTLNLPTLSSGLVWNTSNLTVNGSISVAAVSPVLTSIGVTPATASVGSLGAQQFTAIAYDQYGVALASQPTFTWRRHGRRLCEQHRNIHSSLCLGIGNRDRHQWEHQRYGNRNGDECLANRSDCSQRLPINGDPHHHGPLRFGR